MIQSSCRLGILRQRGQLAFRPIYRTNLPFFFLAHLGSLPDRPL